jgi:hypothetical protein
MVMGAPRQGREPLARVEESQRIAFDTSVTGALADWEEMLCRLAARPSILF